MSVQPAAPGPRNTRRHPLVPILRPAVGLDVAGEPELTSAAFKRALATNPAGAVRAVMALNLAVHDAATLLELLSRAVRIAQELLPGVRWVSVTADVGAARPFTVCSSDPVAEALDGMQYAMDDGPCLRAVREGRFVSLDIAGVRSHWPELADAAERTGVARMLAGPLSHQQGPTRGAMNLFASAADAPGSAALDVVTVLSECLGRGLDQYAALHAAAKEAGQLRSAMQRRAGIEQAKGILMTRHQVSADEAFELLRTQSQHTNVKLAVVAEEIVRSYPPSTSDDRIGTGRRPAAPHDDRIDDFQSAFVHAPVGMAVTDPFGRLLMVNRALCAYLGRGADEVIGRSMFDYTFPDDVDCARATCGALTQEDRLCVDTEVRLVRADGECFAASIATAKVLGAGGEAAHLVMHIQDISERRAVTDELRRAAVHDALTGLPNRVLLEDRLASAVLRHARNRGAVSVLYLDLDDFKSVNDTHGHQAGDRVLVSVARLLEAHVRPGDTVARIGGDEFVVLCEHTDEEAAARLAARLTSALAEPIVLPFGTLTVHASLGTATRRGPVADVTIDLLREADMAMYAHKVLRRSA